MKSKLILTPIAVSLLLISGCTVKSKKTTDKVDDPYKVDEQTYNNGMNRDTVVLHSNYKVTVEENNAYLLSTELDYGNIKTNYEDSDPYYYEIHENGDYMVVTSYPPSGYIWTNTMTKPQFYDYFFMGIGFLFDIQYKDLHYDETNNIYKLSNVEVGDHLIKEGTMFFKDGQPMCIELDVKDLAKYKATFTNHGTTKVVLPKTE